MVKEYREQGDATITRYVCVQCGGHHVGHDPNLVAKRAKLAANKRAAARVINPECAGLATLAG